jgi:hypothetical protein
MFRFNDAEFLYEPYPIGLIRPVADDDVYRQLVADYPPIDLFMHLPKVGHKYVLSEKFNPDNYHRFIRQSPVWRKLHAWIKSEEFVAAVDTMLRDNRIDVGLSRRSFSSLKKWRRAWRDLRRGRFPRIPPGLRARFEFSMLPADGGYILPHTDTPKKIITLVISSMTPGEWDPAFGGGTEVNRAKQNEHAFNWLNDNVPFDEVETLHTFEFSPNQCVVFVKTFNSLHCVRPMTGKNSAAMRKTLTINIEQDE